MGVRVGEQPTDQKTMQLGQEGAALGARAECTDELVGSTGIITHVPQVAMRISAASRLRVERREIVHRSNVPRTAHAQT